MKVVSLGANVVAGYDVSHYQSNLNIHAAMKAAGKKFCIIKAIEGKSINDALMRAHKNEAQKQGMIVGFYNFFHPSQNVNDQAKHFQAVVGTLGAGTLGPIGDFETLDGQSAVKSGQEAFDYMSEVCGLVGRPDDGGIYGSPFFLQDMKLPAAAGQKFWAWIAAYSEPVTAIKLPDPFPRLTMFQFTDGGSSNLDLNLFNGSYDQLKKMAKM